LVEAEFEMFRHDTPNLLHPLFLLETRTIKYKPLLLVKYSITFNVKPIYSFIFLKISSPCFPWPSSFSFSLVVPV
jgi:hypothetical protein